jgi:hypothetical protein
MEVPLGFASLLDVESRQTHPKKSWYMMYPGATPKEMESTNESSSAPKRDPVRVKRAIRPSSMSNVPAKTMNQPAQIKSPRVAATMA